MPGERVQPAAGGGGGAAAGRGGGGGGGRGGRGEGWGEGGAAAGRAGRPVELAHRGPVRRANERALPRAVKAREDLVAGRSGGDRDPGPLADRLPRARDPPPVRRVRGVGGGPGMAERIEDDATARRVRGRIEVGEGRRERGAEAVERSGKRERVQRDHGADALTLAQGKVKSTALLLST